MSSPCARRATDSRFKRGTASLYYRILNWLGADIIPHHADFFFSDIARAGFRLEIDLPDIFTDDGNRKCLEGGNEKEKQ
ncbi:MAG: hypothetical protein WA769_18820, partial [Pseudolabrys sp.]